jgi:hypothetical protein
MKKTLAFLAILAAFYFAWDQYELAENVVRLDAQNTTVPARAFGNPRSGSQVQGSGTVVRVLSDDDDGSRHQRFILQVDGGRTLLVAHNIDLAPRVQALRAGDAVEFNGVFEANDKGGVIHWTHRDPRGEHVAGWVKHKGRIYQ